LFKRIIGSGDEGIKFMLTIKVDKKKITLTDISTGLDVVLMLYSVNKKLTKEIIEHLKSFRESTIKITDNAEDRTIELDENLNPKTKEK
jgi:hypothetical protein